MLRAFYSFILISSKYNQLHQNECFIYTDDLRIYYVYYQQEGYVTICVEGSNERLSIIYYLFPYFYMLEYYIK